MNGMSASDKIFQFLDAEKPEKGELAFTENEKNGMSVSMNQVDFSYEEKRQILLDK